MTSLDARRSTGGTRPPRFLMAVAAAILVVVALGAVLFQRAWDDGTELVASSDLALVAGGGTGRAELLRSGDQTVLRVDVSGLSPTEQSDFYELWLLDAGGGNPQPLSTFTEQDAVVEIELPAGLSTTEFPVVDISEEVDDGDVTHSGRSILRGELV